MLELEEINRGELLPGEDTDFFYAHDIRSNAAENNSVVVSCSTRVNYRTLAANGVLCQLAFRVKNYDTAQHAFCFRDYGITDSTFETLPAVVWQNSASFTVSYQSVNAYLRILTPLENTVIYTDTVDINLLFSNLPGTYLQIRNETAGYVSGKLRDSLWIHL